MKRLYIHIGAEKTGTTTLQSFLTANESVLRKQGFSYFSNREKPYFLWHGHYPIAACLLDSCPDFVPPEKYQPPKVILSALRADLADSPHDVILSCEHLSSRCHLPEKLQLLKEATRDRETKIILYMRRQDKFALSAYSTEVKCGRRAPFNLGEVVPDTRYYNFLATIEPWASTFGGENVIVKNYDRHALVNGDIRHDFLELVGIDSVGFSYGENLNVSLDATQLEVIRLINGNLSPFEDNDRVAYDYAQHIRRHLIGLLPKGAPLSSLLTKGDRQMIMERFAAVNNEVESRYMHAGALDSWRAPFAQAAHEDFGQVLSDKALAAAMISLTEYLIRQNFLIRQLQAKATT